MRRRSGSEARDRIIRPVPEMDMRAAWQNPGAGNDVRARVLGVNPFFLKEYDSAAANYPCRKCMAVISLLKEYDFKGKGGNSGEAGQSELLMELTAKILNI